MDENQELPTDETVRDLETDTTKIEMPVILPANKSRKEAKAEAKVKSAEKKTEAPKLPTPAEAAAPLYADPRSVKTPTENKINTTRDTLTELVIANPNAAAPVLNSAAQVLVGIIPAVEKMTPAEMCASYRAVRAVQGKGWLPVAKLAYAIYNAVRDEVVKTNAPSTVKAEGVVSKAVADAAKNHLGVDYRTFMRQGQLWRTFFVEKRGTVNGGIPTDTEIFAMCDAVGEKTFAEEAMVSHNPLGALAAIADAKLANPSFTKMDARNLVERFRQDAIRAGEIPTPETTEAKPPRQTARRASLVPLPGSMSADAIDLVKAVIAAGEYVQASADADAERYIYRDARGEYGHFGVMPIVASDSDDPFVVVIVVTKTGVLYENVVPEGSQLVVETLNANLTPAE